mmetsp:Transcript_79683/g.234403  ORF Transcript_79683/g.234403 Transcript_79683/m.234403 type:complete len:230 (+) Transcript_79683:94-783(+)
MALQHGVTEASGSTEAGRSAGQALQLCRAARAGRAREVEAIIDADGVAPDVRNADGLTPLMLACVRDGHDPLEGPDNSEPERSETVQVLLERGADVNATGPGDWTALFYAAFYAEKSILQLLLDARADMHLCDEAERDAGSWARYGDVDKDHLKGVLKLFAEYGYRQHVEVLVKQGTVANDFHSPIVLDEAAKAVLAEEAGNPRGGRRSPTTRTSPSRKTASRKGGMLG